MKKLLLTCVLCCVFCASVQESLAATATESPAATATGAVSAVTPGVGEAGGATRAAATPSTAAHAEQQAADLLREAARRTQNLTTLFATFTQEKKLSILDMPLTSSGYLCLERKGGQEAERVLWVYEKPTPSGFAQEKGQAWLWAGEGAARRRAQGAEATALKAVTAQIMAWVRIRPDELQRLYRMERVDAAPTSPTLRLTPRPHMGQAASFFSALEVTLSPELNTVQQLRFVEKNGDSTLLIFDNARVNAELPPQCQSPQPLP